MSIMWSRLLKRFAERSEIRMTSTAASVQKLAGKVAIVTASTEGIGYAIAQRLGQDGAKVMVSSRKGKNVETAVQKLRAENLEVSGVVCHVGKAEDRQNLMKETLAKYGGIDILVSNAATNPAFGLILDTTEEVWDKIFDVNVKAGFLLVKEVVPHMEARGGGSVVFVSSIAGYAPMEYLGPYSVSKTAVLGLIKALAPQLATKNIRVNGIAPGVINTKFSDAIVTNDSVSKMALAVTPMKRFGRPEECAGAVSLLVSEDGSYITGETIAITGGMTTRL